LAYISDELLAKEARTDSFALDNLMYRFKAMVKANAKKYYITSADPEDIVQEGMIGLYKAVLDFDPEKNASFASFASMCVVRQIQTAIKAAGRKKHIPLNTSLSLDNEINDTISDGLAETFKDKLPDRVTNDPAALFLDREALKNLEDTIKNELTIQEQDVLRLHVEGMTYEEISFTLNKSFKSVDNTLQRVRRKIRSLHLAASKEN